MQKPKASSAKPPSFNWTAYRLPDEPIEVVPTHDPALLETVKYGSAGFRCLTEGCGQTLVFLQKTTLNHELYALYCRVCCFSWKIPHKTLVKLIHLQPQPEAVPVESPVEALEEDDFLGAA